MAAKNPFSTKRLQIDKANSVMVIAVAATSFIVVFSLVASQALWGQRSYQARVIDKKEKVRDQLKKNIEATDTLVTAYKDFVGSAENVLGGNASGQGEKDGDNAKLILDALPSKYDFPALATSLEKLLTQNSISIESIGGIDDEVSQASNEGTDKPAPIEIPFDLGITSTYEGIKNLISVFERSVRPISIDTLEFSGSDSSLRTTLRAKTYYQPGKSLKIDSEVVQ